VSSVDGREMEASSVGWGMSGVRGSDNEWKGNGQRRLKDCRETMQLYHITAYLNICIYSVYVTFWFCIGEWGWNAIVGWVLDLCGGE
jgi:hypothetical protein